MADKPHPLGAALCQRLRELEGIPPHEAVEITNIAPYLRNGALRAITDITESAGLLLRSVDPGPPLSASHLVGIGYAIVSAAAHLNGSFSLWLWVLNNGPVSGRKSMLLMASEAILEHAETLTHGAPLSADQLATIARGLLELVKHVHQELNTATTGESP